MTYPLIVIEGIDGAGKTTQAKWLSKKLGAKYIKGGGWQTNSPLASRAEREGSRNRYFSLMQLKQLREVQKMIKEHQGENVTGVVDRLVLVDVAHILSLTWDKEKKDFPKEAKETARLSLKEHIPENVLGIIIDIADKQIIEQRIKGRSDRLPETDTLKRFEAKREAYTWCAKELGWEIINGEGTVTEVNEKIETTLNRRGVILERISSGGKELES